MGVGNCSSMIITIDGPAGTGKSSVSQEVARRLGLDFLDTGAMYRAMGLAAVQSGIDLEDARRLGELAGQVEVDFDWQATPPAIRLNGRVVADQIRSEAASSAASRVAVVEEVRRAMVRLQQQIGAVRPNLVTEGRDQGTVVFPGAKLKIFLDATPDERARRRQRQLEAKGQVVDFEALLASIRQRDARDAGRTVSPLKPAADACVIDTTALSQQQVIDRIVELARERMVH